MKRIIRDRRLTSEEANEYDKLRKAVEVDLPILFDSHRKRISASGKVDDLKMADPIKEEVQDKIRDSAKRYWKLRGCPVGQDLDIWLYAERTVFFEISRCQKLSEDFIREFKDKVSWYHISRCQKLSEDFIREFQDKVGWSYISCHQKLSEEFIREFKDKVDWYHISKYQKLSEEFIREFKDKMNWYHISEYQKLSEEFIREFQDKVGWSYISCHQKLSEEFIREFKDKVYWSYISGTQKLSEDFIREFKDKVDWSYISSRQKLSEDFIREFKDKMNWHHISQYQKLSEDFIKEFDITKPKRNWLYATKEEKLKYIKENTNYQVIDEYILAYKSTKDDGTSVINHHYFYEVGKTYESHCDCNLNEENSFGLSAWTKEGALKYHDKGKLFLVKIYIDDIGAIVQNNNKIRCFKLEVLEEVSKDG